jgi:hypothetical protein
VTSEWQPIETAPDDGTEVLLCLGDTGEMEVGYCFDAEFYRSGLERLDPQPTHWMPLPSPPVLPDTAPLAAGAAMSDYPGRTSFLMQHKRRPTARQDGIAAWLKDEIEYLEGVARTEHGEGALAAYKATLRELEAP